MEWVYVLGFVIIIVTFVNHLDKERERMRKFQLIDKAQDNLNHAIRDAGTPHLFNASGISDEEQRKMSIAAVVRVTDCIKRELDKKTYRERLTVDSREKREQKRSKAHKHFDALELQEIIEDYMLDAIRVNQVFEDLLGLEMESRWQIYSLNQSIMTLEGERNSFEDYGDESPLSKKIELAEKKKNLLRGFNYRNLQLVVKGYYDYSKHKELKKKMEADYGDGTDFYDPYKSLNSVDD